MKKIIIPIFFLLWKTAVFSQIYLPVTPTDYGTNYNRLKPKLVLHIPVGSDTLLNTNDTSAQIRIINGMLMYHYGYWKPAGGGSTSGAQDLQAVTDVGNTTTATINALNFNATDNVILRKSNQQLLYYDANDNVIIGKRVGIQTITGIGNTGFGKYALNGNQTSYYNTAIGIEALKSNVDGENNTALGGHSLNSSQGSYNVGVGNKSLYALSTGDKNTALGQEAGLNLTSGNNNLAIGYKILFSSTTGDNQMNINNMFYSTDGTKVGLYNNNPQYVFDVNGNVSAINYNVLHSQIITQFGKSLISHDTIKNNISIGYRTLANGTTATQLVAIGDSAMYSNTTGGFNTAFGYSALRSNTTKTNNTAIGWGALYANTEASNTAIGASAAYSNTTGNNNTIVGAAAFYYNKTGSSNTVIGSLAGLNLTGNDNIALGDHAMFTNTSSTSVTMIGKNAGYLGTTTYGSTGIGRSALYNTTTGNWNTAIGDSAGYNITTGVNNLMIGYKAIVPNATGNNQMSIGNLLYSADMTKLGIGVNAPTNTLHVNGDVRISTLTDGVGGTDSVIVVNGGVLKRVLASTISGGGTDPLAVHIVDTSAMLNPYLRKFDYTNGAPKAKRVSSITSAGTITPDVNSFDAIKITALTNNITFNAPTGTPAQMQELLIRIKDNGVSWILTWNSIYRASTDLPLPVATLIGKTMYLKFYYNSDEIKWDLVSVLTNF